MTDENAPIIIGADLVVQKEKDVSKALSPLDLLVNAAKGAMSDAGCPDMLLREIDSVAGLRFITDSPEARGMPFGKYPNPGLSVARRLGMEVSNSFYAPTGGNTPQFMISDLANRIHAGDIKSTLLVGGEGLASIMRSAAAGVDKSDWNDDPEGPLTGYGVDKRGVTDIESAHGMSFPVNTYPLLENAFRKSLGRDVQSHMNSMSRLMSRFTDVAAKHPQSWFPIARTPEEIMTVTEANRWVGFPYPKYMNSVIQVDQAAAIILTSVGEARRLGVDESRWVYVHASVDANENWFVSEREDLHRSYAIKGMGELALETAGWSLDDIDYFDLYSCFPVAVEDACRELGLAEDDPRGLTVTGGLPYFGGAGNAYALLSVATMVKKLRENPGKKGMCTANGWYLTKHGFGLYSTRPVEGPWRPADSPALQAQIDAMPKVKVAAHPEGEGVIETYSVIHPAGKPRVGLIIGRLSEGQERFIAHVEDKAGWLDAMLTEEFIGRKGKVSPGNDDVNFFEPLSA